MPPTPRGDGFQTTDGFKKRTPFEVAVRPAGVLRAQARANDRLTLLADAFNLFNLRRTVDYNNNIDFPVFVRPNRISARRRRRTWPARQFQRPFQLRLGVRYGF